MTPFLLYQLKVAGSLAAFTLLFYLLFRKETFYRFNRFYLLASIALSHLLPLVRLPMRTANPQTPIPNLYDISDIDYTAITQTSFHSAPALNIPQLIYGCFAGIIAIYLVYQLISMVALVIRKNPTRLGNYRLILLPDKNQSFSFFNLIFLNAALADAANSNQVLQHELAHARQLHSLDRLIIQVVKIFQWFNPFIYLAEKALQETHEYLADQAVLEQNGEFDRYRLLLLAQVFGVQPGIFSYFNYSLIKNRLTMMTKQKSPFRNRLKYLTVLPLVILLGLLICGRMAQSQDPPKQTKTVIAEPQIIEVVAPEEEVSPVTKDEPVFVFVEKQAKFQGGDFETFREWVQKNLVYPPIAKEQGIFGRVTVQFTVNSKGKACDAVILRGVDPSLDKEVLRILQVSPEWTPAENDGKKVAQQFVMPVIFSLEKKQVTGDNPDQANVPVIVEKKLQVAPENQQGELAFVYVEQQATFQGGSIDRFRDWVQKNLTYPAEAKENGIFGRIVVQFAINADGKMCDVKVLRGVDPSLDKEAIRVITSSPDWVSAKQSGKNVKQQFVMPVVFSQGEKASTINQQNGDTEPSFVFVEEQALFQGGTLDVFREWVQKQLVYPDEAKKQGIFGRITIQFAVNSEGKVCDIKIIRGVHPSLDTETMRVVGQSPVWTPAKQGGRKVKQQFVMPIIFQLQK